MNKWQRISSRKTHQDKWISLRADECRLPNGQVIAPYYVLEENDWVHVFAVDAGNRILVVKQYRYAGDRFCVELPGGVIDPGEEPLQAAKRELKEETGYLAKKLEFLIAHFPNPARQNNRVHLYLASELEDTGETALEDSEEIEATFLSEADLKKSIHSGEFSQSMHIASAYVALDHLGKEFFK